MGAQVDPHQACRCLEQRGSTGILGGTSFVQPGLRSVSSGLQCLGQSLLWSVRSPELQLDPEGSRETGGDDGSKSRGVMGDPGFSRDRRQPFRHRSLSPVGQFRRRYLQHLQHEGDVQVRENARVKEHGAGLVDIQPEAGDLAPMDLEIVLAPEACRDAKGGQACGERGRQCLDGLARARRGLYPVEERNAELARSHDDRTAAGKPAVDVGTRALAGSEVDLGIDVLVTTDQGTVVAVAVEP